MLMNFRTEEIFICKDCMIVDQPIFDKPICVSGAPLAQLVECRTLDCKVAGLNLSRGKVLCPCARHFIFIA